MRCEFKHFNFICGILCKWATSFPLLLFTVTLEYMCWLTCYYWFYSARLTNVSDLVLCVYVYSFSFSSSFIYNTHSNSIVHENWSIIIFYITALSRYTHNRLINPSEYRNRLKIPLLYEIEGIWVFLCISYSPTVRRLPFVSMCC